MKLTVDNFFTHLIFHPFYADTKKDKAKAFIASVACAAITLGLCHVICAIRRRFIHKTKATQSPLDRRVESVKDTKLPKPILRKHKSTAENAVENKVKKRVRFDLPPETLF